MNAAIAENSVNSVISCRTFDVIALQCESLMKSVSAKASCSAMTTQGESGGGAIRAERCFVKLAQMLFLMTKRENVTNVWTQSSN
jgi:hypothetical protein